MIKIDKIGFRLSGRGVPHQLIRYTSYMFGNENNPSTTRDISVCWFGKGQFYRVFDWNTHEQLVDIPLAKGQVITMEELIDKMIAEFTKPKEQIENA